MKSHITIENRHLMSVTHDDDDDDDDDDNVC